jgi:tetratricopeptide (TPR) repeat protein
MLQWDALPRHLARVAWLVVLFAAGVSAVPAAPIVPTSDDQVIERLPALPRPGAGADPAAAVAEARALMEAGRREADPRLAGRALARLARWQADPRAPAGVVVVLADIEQHLHRFDSAVSRLDALVQREPGHAQAWLMLATLHRVQGRYGPSDAACRQLLRLNAGPYGEACAAENLALQGGFDPARQSLQEQIARTPSPSTRAWLLTTLAELELRAGRPAAAEQAFKRSLATAREGYTALAYADFLLQHQRPREAWSLLQPEPRSDATLLRLALAARQSGLPEAAALDAELRARFAAADLRPGWSGHERERAWMALEIDRDPRAALKAARANVARQREPADLLLLARSAQAAGDAAALEEARELARRIGMQDRRLSML